MSAHRQGIDHCHSHVCGTKSLITYAYTGRNTAVRYTRRRSQSARNATRWATAAPPALSPGSRSAICAARGIQRTSTTVERNVISARAPTSRRPGGARNATSHRTSYASASSGASSSDRPVDCPGATGHPSEATSGPPTLTFESRPEADIRGTSPLPRPGEDPTRPGIATPAHSPSHGGSTVNPGHPAKARQRRVAPARDNRPPVIGAGRRRDERRRRRGTRRHNKEEEATWPGSGDVRDPGVDPETSVGLPPIQRWAGPMGLPKLEPPLPPPLILPTQLHKVKVQLS